VAGSGGLRVDEGSERPRAGAGEVKVECWLSDDDAVEVGEYAGRLGYWRLNGGV
jgi:hypothetical protein